MSLAALGCLSVDLFKASIISALLSLALVKVTTEIYRLNLGRDKLVWEHPFGMPQEIFFAEIDKFQTVKLLKVPCYIKIQTQNQQVIIPSFCIENARVIFELQNKIRQAYSEE